MKENREKHHKKIVKKSEKYLKTKIKCCIGYFLLQQECVH